MTRTPGGAAVRTLCTVTAMLDSDAGDKAPVTAVRENHSTFFFSNQGNDR